MTSTEAELRGLHDRVKAVTGPDRELGRDLIKLVRGPLIERPDGHVGSWSSGSSLWTHGNPVASIDGAAALIAGIYPGAGWTLFHYGSDDPPVDDDLPADEAERRPPTPCCRLEGKSRNEHGATHALAMIAALLWAMMEAARKAP